MTAVAVFQNGKGLVHFRQPPGARWTQVEIRLRGLKPNAVHAIHVHEFGDLSKGCKTLGAHWNPDRTTHGSFLVPERPRHRGDLINNVKANKNGTVSLTYTDHSLRVRGPLSILGRSVIVHRGVDDLGLGKPRAESLKTGNAGGRIACAVIGRAS